MNGVLVDTSVWVDHFRQRNQDLIGLLGIDLVLSHPMILGELACGTPPERTQVISDIGLLRQAQQASLREVTDFIEREKLYGLGCGIVDMILLTSTLMTPGAILWTLDRQLATLAERFGVLHRPSLH